MVKKYQGFRLECTGLGLLLMSCAKPKALSVLLESDLVNEQTQIHATPELQPAGVKASSVHTFVLCTLALK